MNSSMIQGSSSWLELRKKFVCSSDCSAILGISPWRTAQQLFDEKMGRGEPQEENFAMRRGKDLEEEARKQVEKDTGIIFFPAVKISTQYPWLLCSLDGIDIEGKHMVELKCPGKEDHEIAKQGDVPHKYYAQVQQQMIVTGLKKCYYYSYKPNSFYKNILLIVDYDEDYCNKLIETTKRFWDCMQTGELTDEFKDIKHVYKEMDESWSYSVDAYKEYSEQIKKLEKLRDFFRDDIISRADGKNFQGYGIKVSKHERIGCVDYSLIPELTSVKLDQYRKPPTTYWKVENVKCL